MKTRFRRLLARRWLPALLAPQLHAEDIDLCRRRSPTAPWPMSHRARQLVELGSGQPELAGWRQGVSELETLSEVVGASDNINVGLMTMPRWQQFRRPGPPTSAPWTASTAVASADRQPQAITRRRQRSDEVVEPITTT
jgi:hypothetical protein